jgi:hypothetical protein
MSQFLWNATQDYDNLLVVISGFDGMHDLQFEAAPAAAADFRRGALVSLNASGEFVAGLSGLTAMPLWAINDTADLDVVSDAGNTAGGVVSAYPATGGYELATTEFDAAGTYAPNTLLTEDTVTAGFVVDAAATNYNDLPVVGCVSVGVRTEVYGQTVLQFWPMFIPAVDLT